MFFRTICFVAVAVLWTAGTAVAQQVRVSPFVPQGGSGGFINGGRRILYEKKNNSKEQYYEIHVADTNGANDTCISCRSTLIPQRHNGCATMHPSERWIIFLAEKAQHPGSSFEAIPGLGAYSDIWVMSPDGKKAWQLTDIPSDSDHGVIAPRFSADGKKLVWVERKKNTNPLNKRQMAGYWIIRTADFTESPEPKLTNLKSFEPGGDAFYETYGFSPDGKRILFCSNMKTDAFWLSQVYTMDAETGGDIKALSYMDYNEHAIYTPDGKQIVWMTNLYGTTGTDWWIMNADGTMKQPLTYFNMPAYPHYMGKNVWAGTGFFSPDQKQFVGGVQTSLLKQEGKIVKLDFIPGGNGNGLKGTYYANETFSGEARTRRDAVLAFRWLHNQPDSLFKTKAYSVRWEGQVEALYKETYTFYMPNDKNIRLWVNEQLLISDKTPKNKYNEKFATLAMEPGVKYRIKVEYHNKKTVDAHVKLAWSSAKQYKQIIPASQLFSE